MLAVILTLGGKGGVKGEEELIKTNAHKINELTVLFFVIARYYTTSIIIISLALLVPLVPLVGVVDVKVVVAHYVPPVLLVVVVVLTLVTRFFFVRSGL